MSKRETWPIGPLLWTATIASLTALTLLASWLWTAPIGGAIHLPAEIEILGGNPIIEHRDGGTVAEIFMHDGAYVAAGTPLLRLDGSALIAEHNALLAQLYAHTAQIARLNAERDGRDSLELPAEAQDLASAQLEQEMRTQSALFQVRQQAHQVRLDKADLARAQLAEQRQRVRSQIAALDRELELVLAVITSQQQLSAQGLSTANRLLPLQQQQAGLSRARLQSEGELAELEAAEAETLAGRARHEAERREEILTEIQNLTPRIAALHAQRKILEDRMGRLTLIADLSGTIHELQVRHPGDVIELGQQILSIIPSDAPVIAATRLPTEQISQVALGQRVFIQTSDSAHAGAAPLNGKITLISAGNHVSDGHLPPFFRVEVAPDAGRGALRPGMAVQLLVQMPA